MLEQGLIMPVSLEMDADSDEELETLAEMYDQGAGGNGDNRGQQVVTRGSGQCVPAARLVHCRLPDVDAAAEISMSSTAVEHRKFVRLNDGTMPII